MRVKCCVLLSVFLVPLFWTRPSPAADKATVAIEAGKESVDFLIGGTLVTRYNIGPTVAKPYFWPLNGPGGVPLTRAWPMAEAQPGESTDHVHQKSAWFGHGDVLPEGMTFEKNRTRKIAGIDFWTEEPGHGRMVCTEVGQPTVAGDHGQILTRNEWRTADGVKILDETRVIQLHDLAAAGWLLVLDIDLHASAAPITFGDTDEGTMGVRINDALREEVRDGKQKKKGAGRLESSEGRLGAAACWGYPAAWNDYSGPLGGKVVGLAILADPLNPYPSCWQSRNYGLMAANPFARDHSGYPAMKGRKDLVKLAQGEHLKLRYGILIHPGDAEAGKVTEQFRRFVELAR